MKQNLYYNVCMQIILIQTPLIAIVNCLLKLKLYSPIQQRRDQDDQYVDENQ